MPDRDTFDDLPILAELRDLLGVHMREGAAARRAATEMPRRRPGWAATGLRRAGLAIAIAVALAVVAVGLVALHHGGAARQPATNPTAPLHHPSPGPSPAVSSALNRARQQTIAHDPACQTHANHGATIDHGSPGVAILSRLAVLRRPPLPADSTNKVLYSMGWDAGSGVYVNYIRRARTAYGRSYWIVPEARITPFGPIPARCYREFHAALVHDLRHAPPSRRAQVLRAQRDQLSAQRAQGAHREGLCFIEIGLHVRAHPGAVGFGCSPGTSGLIPPQGGNGSGDPAGGTIMSGMAADGIVAVTVHYDALGAHPAHTITSNVVNNVYVLKIPADTAHQPFPSRWLVRMADGRVVSASAKVVQRSG